MCLRRFHLFVAGLVTASAFAPCAWAMRLTTPPVVVQRFKDVTCSAFNLHPQTVNVRFRLYFLQEPDIASGTAAVRNEMLAIDALQIAFITGDNGSDDGVASCSFNFVGDSSRLQASGSVGFALLSESSDSATEVVMAAQPVHEGVEFAIKRVSSGQPYTLGTARLRAEPYIDRDIHITALGPGLANGDLIRTANADKAVTAARHLILQFVQVDESAVVYVAFDRRGTLPDWLAGPGSGWTSNAETIETTGAASSPFRVFQRYVQADEKLVLGGNLVSGASGAQTNYFVIVTK